MAAHRPTSVTARYQASDAEAYTMCIEIPNDYPDAMHQATTEAVRGVREMLATAIALVQASQAEGVER